MYQVRITVGSFANSLPFSLLYVPFDMRSDNGEGVMLSFPSVEKIIFMKGGYHGE